MKQRNSQLGAIAETATPEVSVDVKYEVNRNFVLITWYSSLGGVVSNAGGVKVAHPTEVLSGEIDLVYYNDPERPQRYAVGESFVITPLRPYEVRALGDGSEVVVRCHYPNTPAVREDLGHLERPGQGRRRYRG